MLGLALQLDQRGQAFRLLPEQIVYKRHIEASLIGIVVQLPSSDERRFGAFVQEVVKEHFAHIELAAPVTGADSKQLLQHFHALIGTMELQINSP